jgi:hypothetical protein
MRTRALAGLAVLLACVAPSARAATPVGPLAPAADGKFQCFGYDRARKTCQSTAGYAAGPGDTIENTATLLIGHDPTIVMTTISPVTVEGQRVCGPIRAEDLESATFLVSGSPPDEDAADALRAGLKKAMVAMLGKQVCVTLAPDGGGLVAHATIDAVPQPDSDQRVIWVSPADGWTVAP